MAISGGFPSGKLEHRVDSKNSTIEPVRPDQFGASVLAYSHIKVVTTGSVVGVTGQTVELSTSAARVGDFLNFTSGTMSGFLTKVIEQDGADVVLGDDFASSLAAADAFEILRHAMPRLNSSNELVTSGGGGSSATTYATNVDDFSATVTYVGKALPGSSVASAVWQISRITTSGTVSLTTYADGDSNFDNIWNNRTSLSYS